MQTADAAFDVDFVRAQFPALETDWALMDNAGGSVVARQVIEKVTDVMSRLQVQLGATYPLSREASDLVTGGREAIARLVGASTDEVVIGPSTTLNTRILADAVSGWLEPGDEVVVTNVDHEANVGPWRALTPRGIEVREWKFDRDTVSLELDGLDAVMSDRTRLVCLCHCSNLVGRIHDVPTITRRVHDAGALVVVDGVAFAPHRRVDVRKWDVDFYLASLYKVYGPHVGLLYGKREHLERAKGQYHFFHGEDEVPHKLMPGNPNHELCSALPGVLEYLELVAHHHGIADSRSQSWLDGVFDLFAAHEQSLQTPLLEYLAARDDVHVIGPTTGDAAVRVPTISFVVAGRKSSEVVPRIDERNVAVRWGHFYAYRPARDLGLLDGDGVVRVSLVHYNTHDEVRRLIEALDEVL